VEVVILMEEAAFHLEVVAILIKINNLVIIILVIVVNFAKLLFVHYNRTNNAQCWCLLSIKKLINILSNLLLL
jgi:hypothetical protein